MAAGLKIAIVGGGLAGLAAAMKIAEAGHEVDLISVVPVKRSHSVCAQGGINGAVNTKGEGDSPAKHLDDTVYGGDFLANQPPVKRMCDMAPEIIYLFDRMGVPFSRTKEGLLDFRRFGGTLHHRTAFAGASTGQQLLYALDEQVRKPCGVARVRSGRREVHDLICYAPELEKLRKSERRQLEIREAASTGLRTLALQCSTRRPTGNEARARIAVDEILQLALPISQVLDLVEDDEPPSL